MAEKQPIEWRFDVIVNPGLLVAHMDFAGFTCRSLGFKVGCSHSTIGHYRTGRRKTCDAQLAKKIAKALGCPISPLFLPHASPVLPDARRTAAAV